MTNHPTPDEVILSAAKNLSISPLRLHWQFGKQPAKNLSISPLPLHWQFWKQPAE